MNKNQKTVILIALVLFLICGFFIPFNGTLVKDINKYNRTIYFEDSNSFIGYFPIFTPPSRRELIKSYYKKNDLRSDLNARNTSYEMGMSTNEYLEYKVDLMTKWNSEDVSRTNINLSILIIEIFFLLILTIGLVLLLADS